MFLRGGKDSRLCFFGVWGFKASSSHRPLSVESGELLGAVAEFLLHWDWV